MRRKNELKQILFFITAVLWSLLIFWLSSIPNLQSGLETKYDLVLRKLAHIFVFAVLTFLILNSFSRKSKPFILFAVTAAVIYALTDELHQAGVPNRTGSPRDILIDSVGVYLGAATYYYDWLHKILRKFKK